MSDSIAKKAVADAKEVTRLAVNAAKNEILDELTPSVKKLIERRLRAGRLGEDVDRLRRAADGYGETEFEEGVDDMGKSADDELEAEGMSSLFPSISEGDDEEFDEGTALVNSVDAAEEVDEYGIPTLGEGEEEEGDMDEEIEISEAELAKFYREGLQLEVDVSKGFKDMSKPVASGDQESGGLADKKTGEREWDAEEPPAAQDWTVKEQVKKLVRRGMAENKALRGQNAKLVDMVKALRGKLSETNLFNSKIMHVSKFMNNHRLTSEQKRAVVESLDRATSLDEVKRTYSVLESSFRAAGLVSESRRNKPKASTGARRTSGSPNQKVLRESVDRSETTVAYNRMKQLAGLTNGKK